MSEYGCCTLSSCNWRDREDCLIDGAIEIKSCDDCPYYDPDFFKEEENDADTSNQDQR